MAEKYNGLSGKVVHPNPRRVKMCIEIELTAHEEELAIKGNCSAIDDDTDREQERWIKRQLDNGNPWAWAAVEVKASMSLPHGLEDAEGTEHLGGCSYWSGSDFTNPGGCFDDMVVAAVTEMLADRERKMRESGHLGGYWVGVSPDPFRPGIVAGPFTEYPKGLLPSRFVFRKFGDMYQKWSKDHEQEQAK